MKILKIEFQNINSLRGTNLIDFTRAPFTTGSLFAITGPTGSGKSTILDVISLALFNHVPRLGRISKNDILSKGAILTRNQTEAFAKVTYECKTGIYTSHWSISTARTGNLREYEMEITNDTTGAILDLKKSDVPGKNEELIGLNYNQFIKSVLLAQGEFAQFLRAKKDERGELLEKITGTGIYRQLGRMAFERHKLVNVEIQKQQDFINQIKIDLLPEEEVQALNKEFQDKEGQCKPLEKEIKTFERNLQLKKTIENQLQDIQKFSSEKEKAETELGVFLETFGLKLEQHEKLRDIAEELRTWSRVSKELLEVQKEIQEKTDRKEVNFKEINDCIARVNTLTNAGATGDTVETCLGEFSQQVRKLQEELVLKKNRYSSLQQEFRAETREISCDLNVNDPAVTARELEDMKTISHTRILQLEDKLKDIDLADSKAEKLRLRNNLQLAREAQIQAENLNRINGELQRLSDEEEKLNPFLNSLPPEIKAQEEKVSSLQDKIEIVKLKKQNQLLLSSLEDKREKLIDGEPCPLCGALHHPYAEIKPHKIDTLEEELKELENECALWNRKLTSGTTTLAHYRKALEEVRRLKTQQENDHKILKTSFQEKFFQLKKEDATSWEEVCSNYDGILENLEEYEKEKRNLACINIGLPLLEKMVRLAAEGKSLKQELSSLYPGNDITLDTQKLQTQWTRLREYERALTTQLTELREKESFLHQKLIDIEGALTPAVKEHGFQNLQEAGDSLMQDQEYYKLHTDRDKIKTAILRNTETLNLLNSQLEKFKQEDVQQTYEALQILMEERSRQLEKLRLDCEHLNRKLLNDKENREKILRIREEIAGKEKQIKRWKLLNELIGDSTGKKFNDFAQDLSLSQLLLLANIRLKDLSDRYRIDKPAENEDDGLVAIDEHMGGQRRSVKTLSGGETFILSLSMALALSDLASRNVEINSLFIDEGFGTLDPETLDQTLDTLEKLQAESSKTIGIISHVDSLKERIATQIKLKRHGQGYSTLEITG
ncbi:MAG: SbcC/MukB-like Walker B domain-containing protein [Gillisia sp.]